MKLTQWNNVQQFDSSDTDVKKFVFTAEDAVVETVLYKYGEYSTRTVICCSTQSGCPIGCTFCGTGKFFIKSLSAEQIVEQVEYALHHTGVDPNKMERLQIMVMSMGEPLLNRKGLTEAFRYLYAHYPNADLLISTSGPDVPYGWLEDLSVEIPTIGLQFSVHESTDEARDKLVPFKSKLTLQQMAFKGESWHVATGGRRPFFNYCVHEDNSSDADVARLVNLFTPEIWEATISVICEKDVTAGRDLEAYAKATTFSQKLLQAGYSTRVFDPAGQDDIGGGCGQLHYVQKWAEENKDKVKLHG